MISYNTQQKETYQAKMEEMEIQSVSNNNEMKSVNRDMKSVNMLFDFSNFSSVNNISFMLKYSCFLITQQRENYQARIEEMEIQSANKNKEMKEVNTKTQQQKLYFQTFMYDIL